MQPAPAPGQRWQGLFSSEFDGAATVDGGAGIQVRCAVGIGALRDELLVGDIFHPHVQREVFVHLIARIPAQGVVGIEHSGRGALVVAAAACCSQTDTGGEAIKRAGVDICRPDLACGVANLFQFRVESQSAQSDCHRQYRYHK